MAMPADAKKRLNIIPDLDHILWHIRKEDFATRYLFGRVPEAKGAIAGPPGQQVWAIWTHRYYDRPDAESPDNVLYILRLVVEGMEVAGSPHDESKIEGVESGNEVVNSRDGARYHKQAVYLKGVIQAAQAQAVEWKLDHVKLWDPWPFVRATLESSGIQYTIVERQEDSIASGFWYDENGESGVAPEWIGNEHYAWL